MTPHGDDLGFALWLADAADAISSRHFAGSFAVREKDDGTLVTDADRGVEEALRARIFGERPNDRVLGEEYGEEGPDGGACWIVDPIDGTANFANRIPIWATLIALRRGEETTVAVVSAPELGRRWHATRAGGAYVNGRAIRVSHVDAIERAAWSFVPFVVPDGFDRIVARAAHARGIGDFWQHMLVAEGALEFALDAPLRVWDFAAVALIVEEAGGVFTNQAGEPPKDLDICVSSNGRLHHDVLAVLSGAPEVSA